MGTEAAGLLDFSDLLTRSCPFIDKRKRSPSRHENTVSLIIGVTSTVPN
jgi:hypothetical protein